MLAGPAAEITEPSIAGDMVLHAVQNDEFYIFTHPKLGPLLDVSFQVIRQTHETWDTYRKERGV